MKVSMNKWLPWAGIRSRASIRFRLRTNAGWFLLAGMAVCCLLLYISPFPAQWRPLQDLAAVLQAFLSGLVAAQWLPLWEAEPSNPPRVAPSTERG